MSIKSRFVAIAIVAASASVFAPASGAKLDQGSAPPITVERPAKVAKNPRLESRLAGVAAAAPAQALATARRAGLDTASGRVRVMVEGAAAQAAVVAAGGSVESAVDGLVEALVAPAALNGLSRARGVDRVRAPYHAVPLGTVDSQGVAATSASAWHTAGATGTGAKVAIIDLGFASYAARQATGDLPAGLVAVDFCGGGMGAPEPHGTAVAEIVHEMAPSAQLYLICIDTELNLQQAKDYAKANGITIVNHSVGWFNSGRGDGSGGPLTPDGIVADARANGILWVNAAGNSAQRHWSGVFSDSDGNLFHDFAPGDNGNSIFLSQNQAVCGFLKWDSWPVTNQDFDLYLARSSDGFPVSGDFGADPQTGSEPPTESFCYVNNTGLAQFFFFAIDRFDASIAPRFDLFITLGNALEYRNASGSLLEPATSPNAFAVGAICWSGDGLEPYSSQGPTIDGRVKPDIAGQAAVTSAIYGPFSGCGSSGFTGTSASAPHVAGAAALWKGVMPLTSGDTIREFLSGDALDRGTPGLDSLFGYGRLRLPTVAPTAITGDPGASTRTAIPIGGIVDAGGVPTTYHWEYGTTTAYGSQTPAAVVSGRAPQVVNGTLSGLTVATTYHYRIVATNMFGTARGVDFQASTLPITPPGAVTGSASSLGARRATVAGGVNPNGGATTYVIQYGTALPYTEQTTPVSVGSGSVPVTVTQTLTGLTPGTLYHFRIVATSPDGTAEGSDQTFTTFPSAVPEATTGTATAITSSTALIGGTVHAGGEDTTYQVEYGLTTAYGSVAPTPAAPAGFGGAAVPVTVALSGLSASTTYRFRLVATNVNGRHEGLGGSFTTLAVPPPPPPPPPGGGGGGGGLIPPDFVLTIGHAPTNVAAGESFTYTAVVQNKSEGSATGVTLALTLPDRVEYVSSYSESGSGCRVSSGQAYLCVLDYVGGLFTTSVRVTVRVRENGELRLTGAVASSGADKNPADNSAVYTFTAGPLAPLTPPSVPTAPSGPKSVTRTGTAGPNVLRGGAGNDTLRGLGGNDRLFGGSGNDRLFGGSGNDRLEGHKGRDLFEGGAGNDTVYARDKAVDTIRCGAGRDTVIADRTDKVAKDCETVRRA